MGMKRTFALLSLAILFGIFIFPLRVSSAIAVQVTRYETRLTGVHLQTAKPMCAPEKRLMKFAPFTSAAVSLVSEAKKQLSCSETKQNKTKSRQGLKPYKGRPASPSDEDKDMFVALLVASIYVFLASVLLLVIGLAATSVGATAFIFWIVLGGLGLTCFLVLFFAAWLHLGRSKRTNIHAFHFNSERFISA